MSDHEIFLIGGADDESGVLSASISGDSCSITFAYRDRVLEEAASDFFAAFCKIRMALEKDALIPFCYGASLNVYPSAMSRDMSRGKVAHRHVLGERGTIKSIVRIFDQGPDVIPASVANQRAYYTQWIDSIRA